MATTSKKQFQQSKIYRDREKFCMFELKFFKKFKLLRSSITMLFNNHISMIGNFGELSAFLFI